MSSKIPRGIMPKLTKLKVFVAVWLLLEVGAFVGVAFLAGGGWNAFWILCGTVLLGYLIKPAEGALVSPRGIASKLLLIPGFLSSLAAPLAFVPQVRRWVAARVIGSIPLLTALRDAGSFYGAAPGRDYGAGRTGGTGGYGTGDVIDIGGGGSGKGKTGSGGETAATGGSREGSRSDRALPEIIDVEHEWED